MGYSVWIIAYLWMLFIILTVQCYPRDSRRLNSGTCDQCKPGYFVSRQCSRRHNTVCTPCPDAHFTPDWNLNQSCYPCSKCSLGSFQLKPCTKSEDVLCKTCRSDEVIRNKSFLENCLRVDSDVAEMQADAPITESSENKTSGRQGGKLNIESSDADLTLYGNSTDDNTYTDKERVKSNDADSTLYGNSTNDKTYEKETVKSSDADLTLYGNNTDDKTYAKETLKSSDADSTLYGNNTDDKTYEKETVKSSDADLTMYGNSTDDKTYEKETVKSSDADLTLYGNSTDDNTYTEKETVKSSDADLTLYGNNTDDNTYTEKETVKSSDADLTLYGNSTDDKTYTDKETVLYGSDLGLTEGSGYVFEEKEEDLDIYEFLQRNITVNPTEAMQDELLPVFAKSADVKLSRYSEHNDSIDVEGSGLVLEDMFSGGFINDNLSSLGTKEISSDTPLEVDYSGEGIVLPAREGTVDSSNYTKYTILENSPKEASSHNKRKGHDDNTVVIFADDKTHIEASTEEKEKFDLHQSGIEGRRRTAVIVGVAVGALVFFAAGFITSRYCKKHKVFRVRPKVYKSSKYTNENGNIEGLEFHDLRPGMCVYNEPDDIGSVKVKLIPSDDKTTDQSNKTKPYTGNGTSGKDTYVKRIETLKYMDETDEEADSVSAEDKLLSDSNKDQQLTSSTAEPKQNGMTNNKTVIGTTGDGDERQRGSDVNGTDSGDLQEDGEESGTRTLADGVMSKLNQKLPPIEDERTPMLLKPSTEDAKIES